MTTQLSDDPVAAYYDGAPKPQRSTLLAVRAMLRDLLPQSQEVISYGVPTFKVAGKGIAGLAWYAKHCSYFPMSGAVTAKLADRLTGYKYTKGAVQFSIDEPLPVDLVSDLVAVRLGELGFTSGF